MAKRKVKDAAGRQSSPRAADGRDDTAPAAAAEGPAQGEERTAEEVVRRVLAEDGLTAERVLATVIQTLVDDFMFLHTPDNAPLETPGGTLERLPPSVTALAFRRLMQRLCAENFAVADRADDNSASDEEWINGVLSGQAGAAMASAVTAFDEVCLLGVRQLEQAKAEAELTGEPDPYPHIQLKPGGPNGEAGTTLVMKPPVAAEDDRDADTPHANGKDTADGTMWN